MFACIDNATFGIAATDRDGLQVYDEEGAEITVTEQEEEALVLTLTPPSECYDEEDDLHHDHDADCVAQEVSVERRHRGWELVLSRDGEEVSARIQIGDDGRICVVPETEDDSELVQLAPAGSDGLLLQ